LKRIIDEFAFQNDKKEFMTDRDYNDCVHQFADNVFRFIIKNLRHEEDAKDIVQSAFEKLWINKESVETTKSKSYLFTVAYNQMIDHLRKTKRIQLKDTFPDKPSRELPVHDLKKNLQTALNKLNEVQRSLVMLKDYEGYNYEEIAQITGLNGSQVKVYLHRARLTLRSYLVSPEKIV